MKGWIKLYRSLIEWEWFKQEHYLKLYLYLYAKASESNHIWRGINIQRNQVVTSLKSISRDTGISMQSVRTCLNNLERTGFLTRETTQGLTHKVSIITLTERKICEISGGQTNTKSNTQTNKELTQHQHETNTASTQSKEYNNNINIYNKKNYYLDNQQRGGAPARAGGRNSGTDGHVLTPLEQTKAYIQSLEDNAANSISYDQWKREKAEQDPSVETPS